MKKLLKKILLGITLPQEYLCLNLSEFNKPLRVVIKSFSSKILTDITKNHLFIGYKPLVIALDKKYLNDAAITSFQQLTISFQTDVESEIAKVDLELVKEIKLNSNNCLVFKGKKGVSSFANPFHKLTRSIYYYLTSDKKQNIFLAGNLYEQIKIAYSIPRKIYLATVGSNSLFNIFPTDLSGKYESEYFIMSLRTGGKANQQIVNEGKCLISVMEATAFPDVYHAGKNHMKELTEIPKIGVSIRNERSNVLKLPVPLRATKYYELESIEKCEVGIHTIHFFKIINSVELNGNNSVLAHIHRDYAEWRLRNGMNLNYLIRK